MGMSGEERRGEVQQPELELELEPAPEPAPEPTGFLHHLGGTAAEHPLARSPQSQCPSERGKSKQSEIQRVAMGRESH